MTDYDDAEGYELCGVSYKTGRMRANEIAELVFATNEWVDYAVAKDRVQYGKFEACSKEGELLVKELVLAYRAAFYKTMEIVKRELEPDS